MSSPRCGVVIVNWNLVKDTLECLRSVFLMDYPAFDVVVVDNGSTDDSVERISQAFPQVHQITNGKNEGFAVAANQGIEWALAGDCEYVLILNNDTSVASDLLDQLVAVGEGEAQIGIVSPRILYFDEPTHTWQLAARWHRWLPLTVQVRVAHKTLLEADFVTGCGMLLRRRLLEEVGVFDPGYFMYGEDLDLCARAKQHGYRVVAVPQAWMWHKVSVSAGKVPTSMSYWRTRNQILVYRRYSHGPLTWLLPICVLLKTAVDVARRLLHGQATLVGPTLRGMHDGLFGQGL